MIAWHYTIGVHYPKILATGMLLPATEFIHPNERPVVWFSLDQRFEPTARKMLQSVDGTTRVASMSETREFGLGVYRFGTPATGLLCGEALRRAARMPPKVWKGLQEVGVKQGAKPSNWLGHVGPLPIAGMQIETMNDEGNWSPV